MKKAIVLTLLMLVSVLGIADANARAKVYPEKPIRLIVPFPPGGPTDIVARLVAAEMSNGLKQSVIVENIPGAGGNIGTHNAVQAKPDGYTLLMGTLQNIGINPHLFKLGYDPLVDLVAVSPVVMNPNVMLANATLPFDDLQGFIRYAKANPGKVAYASSGNGSSTHLSGELLNRMAGLSLLHVPYKGSAPALVDLMGGQVQISFDNVVSAYPYLSGGKLKAIAVTTPKRVPSLPNVPTMEESGLVGFETAGWSGIFAPAHTPDAIVQQLNAEIQRVLSLPQISEKLVSSGSYPETGTAAEYADFVKAETIRWGKVVKDAKIVVQ